MARLCMRKQGGAEELKAAFNAYIRKVCVCGTQPLYIYMGQPASRRNNPSPPPPFNASIHGPNSAARRWCRTRRGTRR